MNVVLNCFQHFLVFIFAVSDCVSISAFASLVAVPVGFASSAEELKICTITAGVISQLSRKRRKNIIK